MSEVEGLLREIRLLYNGWLKTILIEEPLSDVRRSSGIAGEENEALS